jgi:peptide-methionine (S)-S-oxide reductase
MLFSRQKPAMIDASDALPGRAEPGFPVPTAHEVLGTPISGPVEPGLETAYFALGCFWGAEKTFWSLDGVVTTAVGYQGGYTPHPTYEEVCSARTGHTEAVKVVFDPNRISYADLVRTFFESHDPTQGMRQGNDIGSQYRSAIYTTSAQQASAARAVRDAYAQTLREAGYGEITTELAPAGEFFYAEGYHQQYLAKNPYGYCPDHGTGVSCPIGLGVAAEG